ncbi:hypothetical protein ACXN5S_01545 [Pseudoroseicyclus sp. H15]
MELLFSIFVVALAIVTVFSIVLSWTIIRAGRHRFEEAQRLQGDLSSVSQGKVKPSFEVGNDPRVVEGMEQDSSGVVVRNTRLSDDYLKSIFGS